jgi:hypothetical protein
MSQTATAAATQTDRFGVPLKGWSLASTYAYPDDGEGLCATVECDTCGDAFVTNDPDTDTTCAICLMPPAEVAALRAMVPAPASVACLLCGQPIYRGDADDTGTRHAHCGHFIASLDARRATRNGGDAIAA